MLDLVMNWLADGLCTVVDLASFPTLGLAYLACLVLVLAGATLGSLDFVLNTNLRSTVITDAPLRVMRLDLDGMLMWLRHAAGAIRDTISTGQAFIGRTILYTSVVPERTTDPLYGALCCFLDVFHMSFN